MRFLQYSSHKCVLTVTYADPCRPPFCLVDGRAHRLLSGNASPSPPMQLHIYAIFTITDPLNQPGDEPIDGGFFIIRGSDSRGTSRREWNATIPPLCMPLSNFWFHEIHANCDLCRSPSTFLLLGQLTSSPPASSQCITISLLCSSIFTRSLLPLV